MQIHKPSRPGLTLPSLLCACASLCQTQAASIEKIWLTHQTNDPAKIVINWQTSQAGNSVVEFGQTASLGEQTSQTESVNLHHVEIALGHRDVTYHYRVRSGEDSSAVYSFQGYPSAELRVAVVADTGFATEAWDAAVLHEKPHLLVSAGDHVPALHKAQPVAPEDCSAFLELVGRYPALFRSTPWMPLLGNHDREIRSRGPKPPPEPVYDIEATAFRNFFALPAEEWKWHFDLPEFGLRLVALDLSHLSDQGTTWQTCHPYSRGSVQFEWYRDLMATSKQPFLITFYNENNSKVRGLEGGEWGRMIAKSSLAVTGYGYYGERAEANGLSFYNTSVSGTGTPYKDPQSVVFKREDNFLLLTAKHAPSELKVELKNLHQEVLDSKTFSPRSGEAAP